MACRAPRAAASNLARPLVPRPLDVIPDAENHQIMLQDELVYAVVQILRNLEVKKFNF